MKSTYFAIALVFCLGCSSVAELGKQAFEGVKQGVQSAADGNLVKDIGSGEDSTSWSENVKSYKPLIDQFVSSFTSPIGFSHSVSHTASNRCAYYGSSGQRNGASLSMGGILPQVFAKCYLNNTYVEIYTYPTAPVYPVNGVKLTQMERAMLYFQSNGFLPEQYAINQNVVIVFDKVDQTTTMVRNKFLMTIY